MRVVPQAIRALQPLLEGIARVERDCALTDITQDSRAASPGCAFLACAGRTTHGLRFATQAVERGARAILWEPALNAPAVPEFHSDIIVTPVDSLSVRAGEIADRFFGAPSAQLAVTGVTGTNGKTTTAYLLAQLWTAFGSPAAYLGTIGTGLPGALTGPLWGVRCSPETASSRSPAGPTFSMQQPIPGFMKSRRISATARSISSSAEARRIESRRRWATTMRIIGAAIDFIGLVPVYLGGEGTCSANAR